LDVRHAGAPIVAEKSVEKVVEPIVGKVPEKYRKVRARIVAPRPIKSMGTKAMAEARFPAHRVHRRQPSIACVTVGSNCVRASQ
jgi:hypothetical protein